MHEMADHPTTYNADPAATGVQWDDRASIHADGDGQGLLDGAKALHRGTLAEMIALYSAMPDEMRAGHVIQKAGDHRLEEAEIAALRERPDYPGKISAD
jgi:hypothetical protein